MRRQLIGLALPIMTGVLLVASSRPVLAGGGGCFQPDTQGTGTTVTLTERCFGPTVLYVQPGDTVTWKNKDGLRHIVAGSVTGWGSPVTLEDGQATTHRFATAGIFPYSCPLHFGMNGVVIVGDGKASFPLALIRPAAASTPGVHPGADAWPLLALAAAVLGAGLGFVAGRRRPTLPR
jgi:plastocyanin